MTVEKKIEAMMDSNESKVLSVANDCLRGIKRTMEEYGCTIIIDPMYGNTWEKNYIDDVIEFLELFCIDGTFEID